MVQGFRGSGVRDSDSNDDFLNVDNLGDLSRVLLLALFAVGTFTAKGAKSAKVAGGRSQSHHESMSSVLQNGCESLRTGGGEHPVVETRKDEILGKLVVNHQSRREVNTVKAPERMPADHPLDG